MTRPDDGATTAGGEAVDDAAAAPPGGSAAAREEGRSPVMIGLGSFLVLASAALVLVLVAGDSAPLWMVGAWFVLALALSLVIGGTVPVAPGRRDRDYDRGNGTDPAITGEPREEQALQPRQARGPQ